MGVWVCVCSSSSSRCQCELTHQSVSKLLVSALLQLVGRHGNLDADVLLFLLVDDRCQTQATSEPYTQTHGQMHVTLAVTHRPAPNLAAIYDPFSHSQPPNLHADTQTLGR